jgi:hypothetical protein
MLYEVSIMYTTEKVIWIEAESEDEAMDIALNKQWNMLEIIHTPEWKCKLIQEEELFF